MSIDTSKTTGEQVQRVIAVLRTPTLRKQVVKEDEGLRTCLQQSKEGVHIQDEATRVLCLLQHAIYASAMDIDDSAFLGFSFPVSVLFVLSHMQLYAILQYFYYMSVLMVEVTGEKYELREAEKEGQI